MKTNRKNTLHTKKKSTRTYTFFLSCIFIMSILFMKENVITADAKTPEHYKYYTTVYVDCDTTLWDISKEYCSDEYPDIHAHMEEIKQINHLNSDDLPYGVTLCVPYYSEKKK